eukprot:TRINITY_DN4921_c0_g1_i1.p1 TRINITY_DN4921_c0_g1~~TRINITY_DN4921_c0_g1_i1.p1  ORF type:complete len:217 (+),score=49.67 TRINITY_DN4921_c0_g1_i1:72-722(+)
MGNCAATKPVEAVVPPTAPEPEASHLEQVGKILENDDYLQARTVFQEAQQEGLSSEEAMANETVSTEVNRIVFADLGAVEAAVTKRQIEMIREAGVHEEAFTGTKRTLWASRKAEARASCIASLKTARVIDRFAMDVSQAQQREEVRTKQKELRERQATMLARQQKMNAEVGELRKEKQEVTTRLQEMLDERKQQDGGEKKKKGKFVLIKKKKRQE